MRHLSPRRVILGLMALHVLLKLAVLPGILKTPLQGDEVTYQRAASSIADALRSVLGGDGLPVADLQATVVDHGWFMPGSSLLLTPLYVIVPDASADAARLWMGTLTLIGFLAAVAAIARTLGRSYAAVLLVVPGLVPLWIQYSYTVWGDLAGGIALLGVVALLVHLWARLRAGHRVRVREALLLGLLLAVTLYLRSSVLPLVLGVLTLCVLTAVALTRGRERWRALTSVLLAAATFAVLLFPWSYAVSRTFDHRVVTTTTVPISMAFAFGDQKNLCLGPCPPGNVWYAMTAYAAEVERTTGENQLAVQQRMSDRALEGVTAQSYAADVLDNFGRYVFDPTGFEPIFRTRGEGVDPADLAVEPPTRMSDLGVAVTLGLYYGTIALAVVALFAVRRVRRRAQVTAILTSLLTAALMTQPFVHVGSPRYWPVFLPMIALVAAGLVQRPDPDAHGPWLRRIQILIAGLWALGVAALVVVGR